MLRLRLAGKCGGRIKFRTYSRVNPFDFDRFQVCGFPLRLLTRNFFDLAIEPFEWDHFEVGHLCVEPDTVLTAAFDIDHKRFLAWPGRMPRDGERVRPGIEMERDKTTGAHMGDSLQSVEEPADERLLAGPLVQNCVFGTHIFSCVPHI
jgi:hypothetical protein